MKWWINPKAQLKDLIESAFDEITREERIWTPSNVHAYIVDLLAEKAVESPPANLIESVRERHFSIPKDPLERFEHLKNLADDILYWRGYWQIPCPFKLELQAQDYYEGAAIVAKKIHEQPEVFFCLAEELHTYTPLLRQTCKRIVA